VIGTGVSVGTITVAVIDRVGSIVGLGVEEAEKVGVATLIKKLVVGVLVGIFVGAPNVHPASMMVNTILSMVK